MLTVWTGPDCSVHLVAVEVFDDGLLIGDSVAAHSPHIGGRDRHHRIEEGDVVCDALDHLPRAERMERTTGLEPTALTLKGWLDRRCRALSWACGAWAGLFFGASGRLQRKVGWRDVGGPGTFYRTPDRVSTITRFDNTVLAQFGLPRSLAA